LIDLQKANILVSTRTDEVKKLEKKCQHFVKKATSANNLHCLELSVSEHCNYKCVYCTFWRNKKQHEKEYISFDVAERAVRDFLRITRKKKNVLIYFGTAEPLLNWEIIVRTALLAREIRSDVALNLITNGSLITEDKLQFCKKFNINVGISLDGVPERQRAQRIPISKSIDSSKAVLNALELGEKIGFTFNCLSATYRDTGFTNDIDYLISLCQKFGIKEFDLDFDINSLDQINKEILINELLYGYKKTKENSLNIFGYWLIPYINITDLDSEIKSFCGNVVGKSICISSRGNFKLCGYEPTDMVSYSFIKSHLASDKFREICKNHMPKMNQLCDNCPIEGVCGGQCMLTKKGSEVWQQACNFYRDITTRLLLNDF